MVTDMQPLRTMNLIGGGRVGQTLARLWALQNAFAVQDVLTTSLATAQLAIDYIGTGHAVDQSHAMRGADVWMLAVPDAHIATVAQQMADQLKNAPPAIAFHCSGALGAAVLEPLAALGWGVASAHCILSFASIPDALAQFPGTPCALEGDASACALLDNAFTTIGAQCFGVRSEDKVLYHAAAVFATNFLPVLQALAEDAWRATGVPAELLPHLRASLLANAVANITRLGPAGALTGPAARGDVAAIARQAQVVKTWDPQAGAAYEALSALALRMAAATKAIKDSTATPATTS
jgi:predicted short-subunit dehydrogenase-like oxidoreductase (DUF2520 family)